MVTFACTLGIQDSVVRRDTRFGYVELATAGYRSRCSS